MTASKSHGTALVTGASTGIGAIYADRPARRGYDLFLVACNHECLEAVAQRLTHETGRLVDLIAADLNNREALRPNLLRAMPAARYQVRAP
jgi:short-subunit dehydrogenase